MDQTLENRLKALEASVESLQGKLAEKEREIQDLQDIESIKTLQNAYGYYLEHWMSREIIDLFAEHEDVSATFAEGTYLGIEGVRRYFNRMDIAPPEFLHTVMQISPIITLGEDRQTAKGRFYGYGTICTQPVNNGPDPIYMSVTYEMDYLRQDGVWKILKLAFIMNYAYKVPGMNAGGEQPRQSRSLSGWSPDIWAEHNIMYPSGYIYPFHFKHPVTGKETREAAHNAGLALKPAKFGPTAPKEP